MRSVEGGCELVVVVGPPAAPAGVAFAATSAIPQRGEGRVAGVDAAPDGSFDAVDGIVHRCEQFRATGAVQSVGVGDESEPSRAWSTSLSIETHSRASCARS